MRLASKQLNDLIRLGERSLTATSIFAFRLGPLDAFALCRSPGRYKKCPLGQFWGGGLLVDLLKSSLSRLWMA